MSASSSPNRRTDRAAAAARFSGAVAAAPLKSSELAAFAFLLGTVAFAFTPIADSQFTLPKLASFYAAMAVCAVMWIRRHRNGGTIDLPLPIAISAAAFASWWIVSLPLAVHVPSALWGATGRGNGLFFNLALLVLFAGVASLRIAVAEIRRVLVAALTVVVILSAYALVQAAGWDVFVWPNVRPGSTIGHPVPLAAILALAAPIGVGLTFSARRASVALAATSTAVILFALGTTLSRGPWIGAAVGLAVTAALLMRMAHDRRARTFAIVAGVLAVVAATIWLARVPGTRVTQRLTLIANPTADPSFMNRFEYFSAALAIVRSRPFAGGGFESFPLLFPPYRPIESLTVDEDTIPTMVHNRYLDVAVSNGIPGLLLYVALIVLIVRAVSGAGRRQLGDRGSNRDALACGLLGGLLAFCIQDISGWAEVSSAVFFWTTAGLGVSLSAHAPDVARHTGGRTIHRQPSLVVGAVVAAMALSFAFCSSSLWREASADRLIARARHIDLRTGWPAAVDLLNAARPIVDSDAAYLDRIAVVYLNRLRVARDAQAYRFAADTLRAARSRNRFDPYILIHIVDADGLALLAGLIDRPSTEAADAAALAMRIDPNNASVHETLARFELARGHVADGLQQVAAARRLRPQRPGLRLLEGDLRRASGDWRGALECYRAEAATNATSTALVARQKLTAALLENGDYDGALREAEGLVSRMPNDPVNNGLLDAARTRRPAQSRP